VVRIWTRYVITRDFTVAIFVVWQNRVLLHQHKKIGKLLPPGGHIEPNELPDKAALRETLEETGLRVELIGELAPQSLEPSSPLPLVRPRGVQLEFISPGHEHIDLIYFARPIELRKPLEPFRWYGNADLGDAPEEIRLWCKIALEEIKSLSLASD
jgi:8-oxo-dGTP pyrophosphatase MutT (NUDIX family)